MTILAIGYFAVAFSVLRFFIGNLLANDELGYLKFAWYCACAVGMAMAWPITFALIVLFPSLTR